MKSLFNPEKISTSVLKATENTFADFVFMDAISIDEKDVEFNEPLSTQILIHHPFCGEIELTADEELVYKMAENIMMISHEDLTEEQKSDILFELLNTLGGRILALLLPENLTFKLGLPETTESFMERENEICHNYFFKIDDLYLCKITFLAEII